ncbi:hypothetical protein MTO96_014019 [Rhipicephalus appendiculatus]
MLPWDISLVLAGNPARSPRFPVLRDPRPNSIPIPIYYIVPRRTTIRSRRRPPSPVQYNLRKRPYTG